MDYRKIAIRVLAISLTIAALAGVLVLVLPSATLLIAKLIGTAVSTALAAALLLVAIKALENKRFHPLGITLGILTCFIYLCVIGALWSNSIVYLKNFDIPDRLAITAFFATGSGILMLIGAACMAKKRMLIAGSTFFTIWLLVICAWLIKVWFFSFTQVFQEPFIYSILPIQSYSPVIAILLLHRSLYFKTIGLIFAITSCIIVQITLITSGGEIATTPLLFIFALVTAWISSVMAIWNIITLRSVSSSLPKCELATALLIGIALALFCCIVWYEETTGLQYKTPELLLRMSASFGILASTSLLGLLIGRYIRANAFLGQCTGTLHATCPRCNNQLLLEQGKTRCATCGLSFKLKMEGSGCRSCQYDLSGLKDTSACPECGEPIAIKSTVE
jgi:hypothetical protein